jgi:hypothetical protein
VFLASLITGRKLVHARAALCALAWK